MSLTRVGAEDVLIPLDGGLLLQRLFPPMEAQTNAIVLPLACDADDVVRRRACASITPIHQERDRSTSIVASGMVSLLNEGD